MPDFTTTTWVDGTDPAITAAQLNRMEAGILDAVRKFKTGILSARPGAIGSQFWAYFATDDNGGTLYINFDNANWTKITPGLTAGGGAGSWAYDQQVSAVSFVDVPSLDGDTDIEYEVFIDGVVATGGVARNVTLRPNNLTANTYNTYTVASKPNIAPTTGSYDSNGLFIGYTVTGDTAIATRGTFFAKSGRSRKWLAPFSAWPTSSTTTANMLSLSGRWEDTATNVTSLRIDFGGGTFTGRVRVRKV